MPPTTQIRRHLGHRPAVTAHLHRRPAARPIRQPEPRSGDLRCHFGERPTPAAHRQRTLRHTNSADRPKQGRSANSTRSRSFTDTRPSQREHDGRAALVSIVTASRPPASVTSRTFTSPRPTSNSHMTIGSDDNRDSRISTASTPQDSSSPCCLPRTVDPLRPRSSAKSRQSQCVPRTPGCGSPVPAGAWPGPYSPSHGRWGR